MVVLRKANTSEIGSINEIGLNDILICEDTPKVPEIICPVTGIPIWTQIRTVFIRLIMSDLLFDNPINNDSNLTFPARAFSGMSKSILHNALFRVFNDFQPDICIYTVGSGNQMKDGKWFNRLSDHFVTICPDSTLVVEELHEWGWQFPKYSSHVISHAPRQAMNVVVGRLMQDPYHLKLARELVELVSSRAKKYLAWEVGESRKRALTLMLARKIASLPSQFKAYSRFFKRYSPKLLMAGAACYGPSAALIVAARRLGIHTAEFQHGAVSGGHDAYNFAYAIKNSCAYRETLPDSFLSYGSWWGEQINAPIQMVPIGNPHRSMNMSPSKRVQGQARRILILSDGIEFELYKNLACELANHMNPEVGEVVLRPHPIERSNVLAKYKMGLPGVQLDKNVDLYDSMKNAHVLISELSTGLFEAMGLVDFIYIWDTPKSRFCYPKHPFQTFGSVRELVELLKTELTPIDKDLVASCWADGWENRFADYLQSLRIPCKVAKPLKNDEARG